MVFNPSRSKGTVLRGVSNCSASFIGGSTKLFNLGMVLSTWRRLLLYQGQIRGTYNLSIYRVEQDLGSSPSRTWQDLVNLAEYSRIRQIAVRLPQIAVNCYQIAISRSVSFCCIGRNRQMYIRCYGDVLYHQHL